MTRLRKDIRQLAARIVVLREKARSLGVFPGDRDLLECPNCGLPEDVLVGGQLINCRPSEETRDTGLRFQELPHNLFRCPACGSKVREG